MKKLIVLTMVMMLLSGCSSNITTGKQVNYVTETENATKSILTCLSENKADGIKKLLCKRTKSLPDIDKQIQTMLDYFNGKVISYNIDRMSIDKTGASRDGGVWTEIWSCGTVPDIITDKGRKYKELLVGCCSVNANEPDLVGVYTIIIVGVDGTKCAFKLPWDSGKY